MEYIESIVHGENKLVDVPEWLLGMTRNHVGFARVGSNPKVHAFFTLFSSCFFSFSFSFLVPHLFFLFSYTVPRCFSNRLIAIYVRQQ